MTTLTHPHYTVAPVIETIVRCQKDLDKYFKKLFQRFECPLVS